MSILRRMAVVMAAALLGTILFVPAAHADYTVYHTGPRIGACWTKVTAYGGVYKVRNFLRNGTNRLHSVMIQVRRPGVGVLPEQTQVYSAAPGERKFGRVASVSIYANDVYQVYYYPAGERTRVVSIPANGIPYYMNHCQVVESGSAKVRSALSYGLAQLDAIYVGCAAGQYRFGVVPSTTLYHDGRTCGQSRVYKQPAGVRGFDCSGLIAQMFRSAGVSFPWTSSSSIKDNVPRVAKSNIRVGDLLAKYGHVVVYLGDGDGDGVASVLEATPFQQNANGTWTGVRISNATSKLNDPAYSAHRVPGV